MNRGGSPRASRTLIRRRPMTERRRYRPIFQTSAVGAHLISHGLRQYILISGGAASMTHFLSPTLFLLDLPFLLRGATSRIQSG